MLFRSQVQAPASLFSVCSPPPRPWKAAPGAQARLARPPHFALFAPRTRPLFSAPSRRSPPVKSCHIRQKSGGAAPHWPRPPGLKYRRKRRIPLAISYRHDDRRPDRATAPGGVRHRAVRPGNRNRPGRRRRNYSGALVGLHLKPSKPFPPHRRRSPRGYHGFSVPPCRLNAKNAGLPRARRRSWRSQRPSLAARPSPALYYQPFSAFPSGFRASHACPGL